MTSKFSHQKALALDFAGFITYFVSLLLLSNASIEYFKLKLSCLMPEAHPFTIYLISITFSFSFLINVHIWFIHFHKRKNK